MRINQIPHHYICGTEYNKYRKWVFYPLREIVLNESKSLSSIVIKFVEL